MLNDEVGGDVFKKLFIFMMENAVIETPGDGMVKPNILRHTDHADETQNYNWCGYLIDVLDYTHVKGNSVLVRRLLVVYSSTWIRRGKQSFTNSM